MNRRRRTRGVTLWTLLMQMGTGGVVFLGLNAVELDAWTLTESAATRAHLARLAQGLEAYQIDWGTYPYDGYNFPTTALSDSRYHYWYPPLELTTPIAYVSAEAFVDPLRNPPAAFEFWQARHIRYTNTLSTWGMDYNHLKSPPRTQPSVFLDDISAEWGAWRVQGGGPDGRYGPDPGWQGISAYPALPVPYDPTNGTTSLGDIIRSQRAVNGYLNIPNP